MNCKRICYIVESKEFEYKKSHRPRFFYYKHAYFIGLCNTTMFPIPIDSIYKAIENCSIRLMTWHRTPRRKFNIS